MKKIGKFKIIEELGKGGMGIVYKALDPFIDREVAIKVIIEKELGLPEVKERFHREARSAGKLSHENITIVHEVGEVEGKPYIVMEYLRGRNLSELISKKKPIELNQKISYAIQICKALKFAHANKIIHRDIKPENVMVLDAGKIKIMDFGIARPESSTLTQQGMIVGTLAYMSPEQIKGIKIDKRADIFSFGVLLYELLSYKRPFQGDNTTIMYKIVHEEPESIYLEESAPVEDLQEILSKCLQKKPEERYRDCSNIINDLEIILKQQQQDQTISGLLIEGRAFFEEKRLNEAQTRFDKVLEIDPGNEDARFLRQQCVAIDDQIETMIVSAEEAAQKKKVDKFIIDGKALLEKNKLEEALKKFKAALEIEQNNKEASDLLTKIERKLQDELEIEKLLNAGKKYFDQDKYEKALDAFNEVTTIAPSHPESQEYIKKIQTKTAEEGQDAPQIKAPHEHAKTSGKGLKFAIIALIVLAIGAGGWYYFGNLSKATKKELAGSALSERELMLGSKTEAQEVQAETWAEATFKLALVAERKAEKEFKEETFLAAKLNFIEAGNLFRTSIAEAKTNSEAAVASADVESLKEMVATARSNMLKEKSAAEKAGAPTTAKKIFNSALAKEKEADQASKTETREGLLASRNVLLGATAEYKNAKVKARAAAKVRKDSQKAKTAMTKIKRQVPKSERTTNASYQKAVTLESAGNKQFKAGNYRNAKKSFQQARGFYAHASSDILTQGADDSKKSMLQTKSQITGTLLSESDYQLSLQIEAQGDDAYRTRNFSKAKEHYTRAETLYSKVLRNPRSQTLQGTQPAARDDREEKIGRDIQNLLNVYKTSIEKGEIKSLATLLGFTKNEEKNWSGFFRQVEKIKVDFEIKNRQINGDKVTLDLLVRMSYYNTSNNSSETQNFSKSLVLENINGNWQFILRK